MVVYREPGALSTHSRWLEISGNSLQLLAISCLTLSSRNTNNSCDPSEAWFPQSGFPTNDFERGSEQILARAMAFWLWMLVSSHCQCRENFTCPRRALICSSGRAFLMQSVCANHYKYVKTAICYANKSANQKRSMHLAPRPRNDQCVVEVSCSTACPPFLD